MARHRVKRKEIARLATVRDEAVRNAQHLLRSAEKLGRSRHYGFASALAVLAIEETAKALVYHLAANRLFRVVKGKGNGITTFNERDLNVHEFKQTFIASILNSAIRFAPLFTAAQNPPRIASREELRRFLKAAILAQIRHEFELARPNSQLQAGVRNLFRLLGELNTRKNRGLYVDANGSQLSLPRHTSSKSFEEVRSIARDLINEIDSVMQAGYSQEDLALLSEHRRWVAERVRRSKRARSQTR